MNEAMTELSVYAKRKIFERKNANLIKAIKARALKSLAWRSVLKFVKKAKEIKGDPIQEKLLDSEAAIMDEDGNMVVEEGRSSLDFIPVASF